MKKFGKKGIVAVASLIAALSVSAIVPAVANAGGDTTTLPKGFESESVEIKGSNEALSKWMFFFNGDKDAEGRSAERFTIRKIFTFPQQPRAERVTLYILKETRRTANS